MFKIALFTAALVAFANGRVTNGTCPEKVDLKANFDATQYTGIWYQVMRDKIATGENGNCPQTRYTLQADGKLKVFNSQFDNATQTLSNAGGVATCNGAQCGVYFNEYVTNADYRVLDTDYLNYAIVYSCNPAIKRESMWILSRARYPDQKYVDHALSLIFQRVPGYYFDNFAISYQGSACQYYPTNVGHTHSHSHSHSQSDNFLN
jgi:apolipoprotein D and lipocalin family protein